MTPTLEEIRRHFRKETSKLDNWIYHRRLDECLQPPEPEGEEGADDGEEQAPG